MFLKIVALYGVLMVLAFLATTVYFFRKVKDDSFWVKGTTRPVRITETWKDIGCAMLELFACTFPGVMAMTMTFLLT